MNLITKKKISVTQTHTQILSQHLWSCVLQINYSGICTQGFKDLSWSTNKDAIIMNWHYPTMNVISLVHLVFHKSSFHFILSSLCLSFLSPAGGHFIGVLSCQCTTRQRSIYQSVMPKCSGPLTTNNSISKTNMARFSRWPV